MGVGQEGVHRHAAEAGAELGPLGDAVDVARDVFERQLGELVPAPLALGPDHAVDALADFGVEINRLPLTPELVWEALEQAKATEGAGG